MKQGAHHVFTQPDCFTRLEYIRKHKDEPFFCYMPVTIPHLELLVPEEASTEYDGKVEEKPYVDPRKHYADQPRARATYAGMISRMDRDVGRVLNLLRELNLRSKRKTSLS